MSIKKKYADLIESGDKSVEIRGVFKGDEGDEVYIYSSKPSQRIIGRFKVGNILHETRNSMWEKTKDYNGIKMDDFRYFCKEKQVYAGIEIKALEIFENPINPFKIFEGFKPPQNYKIFETEALKIKELIDAGEVKIKPVKIKKLVVNNNGKKEVFKMSWNSDTKSTSYDPGVFCQHPKMVEIFRAMDDFITEYKGKGNRLGLKFD